MKANELMTGAFVYFNCFDGSKIVVRVTGFKDGIVYGDSKKGSHWCNIEKVEPIPLTPEVLEKNGFNQDKYGQFIFNEDTGESEHYLCIVPSYDEGIYWWTVNSEPIAKINHLHELQHIFRLCKIEKEIDL